MDIQKKNRIFFMLMTICLVADFCIGAAIQNPDILANDQNDPQFTSSVPEEDALTMDEESQGDIIITTASEKGEATPTEDKSAETTTVASTEHEISDLETKSDATPVISDASISSDHTDDETEGNSSPCTTSSSQGPLPPKPSHEPDHKSPSSASSCLAFGHIFLSLFAVLSSSFLLRM